ncbi:hypothetical protein ACGFI3_06970 [Nonomuraea wenchangensis]|uniref:effector-associated constant component EACC1 n=1 Tax=Nonomuraea wenchangensis TaxID=568860 RepID=UPI00371FCB76
MTEVLSFAVILGSLGALGALVSALWAWLNLRRHDGEVHIKIDSKYGITIELTAEHVRTLSSEEVRDLTQRISAALEESRVADNSGTEPP